MVESSRVKCSHIKPLSSVVSTQVDSGIAMVKCVRVKYKNVKQW